MMQQYSSNVIYKIAYVSIDSWFKRRKGSREAESTNVSIFSSLRHFVENPDKRRIPRRITLHYILCSRIKITTGRESRMRSRDRRSRLASSTPHHPDFFNLYHSPFHHPLDDPPASAFSLFQAILQFAILVYLPRPPSLRVVNVATPLHFLQERDSEQRLTENFVKKESNQQSK